ncbi:hypothetical protein Bpfe_009706 [Biomphalaria pfeifferi]|uniref:Uncharacterized protein n=1 Tax=Biomphalaria pfeifferi TaxID=112525 RepID=A0AAD8BU12_BIOPF|nr:hypothetical protein Bpfe_009706 [Biomphalaria pfeifferi]
MCRLLSSTSKVDSNSAVGSPKRDRIVHTSSFRYTIVRVVVVGAGGIVVVGAGGIVVVGAGGIVVVGAGGIVVVGAGGIVVVGAGGIVVVGAGGIVVVGAGGIVVIGAGVDPENEQQDHLSKAITLDTLDRPLLASGVLSLPTVPVV